MVFIRSKIVPFALLLYSLQATWEDDLFVNVYPRYLYEFTVCLCTVIKPFFCCSNVTTFSKYRDFWGCFFFTVDYQERNREREREREGEGGREREREEGVGGEEEDVRETNRKFTKKR